MAGPERVALAGANGSGKTSLIEQTLRDGGILPAPAELASSVSRPGSAQTGPGESAPLLRASAEGREAGSSARAGLLSPSGVRGRLLTERVGYLPQSAAAAAAHEEDRSALELIAAVAPSVSSGEIRQRLARMLIRGDSVFRPLRTLSGGERFRVALAKLLFAEPPAQLLVLDEPTNNLDLTSVRQLVEALGQYRGALLVVSHNPRFLADLGIDLTVELSADGMQILHR